MKQIFKIITALACSVWFLYGAGFPTSYYKLNIEAQKRDFVNILKPKIDKSNDRIIQERAFVENFFNQAPRSIFRYLNSNDLKRLLEISKRYRVKSLFDRDAYLKKIDIVPVSLALAQGAIESGWGRSRFAKEANNIFGQWTWGKTGVVPLEREEGMTHKIRTFNTLQDSVDSYMLNLNRHYAYESFREARLEKREKGGLITGLEAAKTLLYYSELREKYVKKLQNMIKEQAKSYNPARLIASD